MKQILVLGGGYAGLSFLRNLDAKTRANAQFCLIDQNDFHYKTTQLHKLAASENLAVTKPFIKCLPKNVKFIRAKVHKITPNALESSVGALAYDELIIAAGASSNPFNITGLEDALEIGDFEHASACKKAIDALAPGASVAVLGAGFSGCELAGSLATEKNLQIDLIEAMPEILPMYPQNLAQIGRKKLEAMGVNICSNQKIIALEGKKLLCKKGDEDIQKCYDAVVFTAGVRGSKLLEGSFIPAQSRRVAVDEFLRVPDMPNIYVIGDCAAFMSPNGRPFAPTAQIAAQMGKYLAATFNARESKNTIGGFTYTDKGSVCSLGKSDAVGFVFGKQFSGALAVWMKKATDLKWDLAIF